MQHRHDRYAPHVHSGYNLDREKGQEKAQGALEEASDVVQEEVCWAGSRFAF